MSDFLRQYLTVAIFATMAIIAMLAAVIAAFFYLRVIVVMYMSGDPEPVAAPDGDPSDAALVAEALLAGSGGTATATTTDPATDVATRNRVAIPLGAGVALAICLAFTIGAGLLPEPLLDFARHATLLKP